MNNQENISLPTNTQKEDSDPLELQRIKRKFEQFSKVTKIAHFGFWEFDVETMTFEYDESWFHMMGTTSQAEGGNLVTSKELMSKYTTQGTQVVFEEKIALALKRTSNYKDSFEIQHRHKSGKIIDISALYEVIYENGKPIKAIGLSSDVTKEKRARDKLLKQQKQLELASDMSGLAFWELNLKTGVFTFNDIYYRFLATNVQKEGGYTKSIEEYFDAFIPPKSQQIVIDVINNAKSKSTNHTEDFEYEMQRRDGKILQVLVNAYLVYDKNGELESAYGTKYDITLHKEREESLKDANQQIAQERNFISTIIESSNAIIAVIDSNGVMTKLNKYGQEFVGYDIKIISREPYFWKKFIPKTTRDKVLDIFKKLAKGNLIASYKNHWISKSGEVRVFEWSNTLVKKDDGLVDYIVSIGIDVTEKDRLAMESLEQKQLFENTFEQAAVGIAHVSPQGNWIKVNQEVCDIVGYSKEEMLRLTFQDITYKDDLDSDLHYVQDMLEKTIDSFTMEKRYIKKDGSLVWINLTVSLVFKDDGQPNYFISVIEDITYKKELLKQINNAKNRFETMFKSHEAIMLLINPDNKKILDANKSAISFYGYSLEEFKGMSIFDINVLSADELEEKIHEAKARKNNTFIFPHKLKNAEIRDVEVRSSPIETDDGVILFSVIKDVTQETILKKQLILAKEEAEKANRAKSEFLSNMSHEIRTPLNGTIGLTNLVLQTQLQPQQKDYLTKALNSSKALLNIINDVLDYTKIEAHKIEIEKIEFRIDVLVDEVLELFAYHEDESRVSFGQTISNCSNAIYMGDPFRIKQILINLVGNAVKFTPKGSISIDVECIEKHQNFCSIRFSIKDTGIGIAKDKQHRLFQSFSQVDVSNTREFGGTGLGLSISKKLVELMGGAIGVNSQEGKGSEFYFTLELECHSKQQSYHHYIRQEHIEETFNIGGRVLLVEDNEINQIVAKDNLQNFGLEVDVAHNGQIAVQKAKEQSYDMIFMDLQMPVMDGYEATKNIRAFDSDIPIIALSAAVLNDDVNSSKEFGMDGHIGKPIEIEELKEVLQKYLQIEPQPKVSTSIEVNETYAGINLKELYSRVNQDKSLARKLLKDFLNNYSDFQKEVAIIKINSKAFESAMHTLKGISGNLALKDIYNYANDIYTSDDLEHKSKMLQPLLKAMEQTKASINEYLAQEQEEKIVVDTDNQSILKSINSIYVELEASAFIPQEPIKHLLEQIKSLDEEKANQLEVYFDRFEYTKAKELLETLKEKIDG